MQVRVNQLVSVCVQQTVMNGDERRSLIHDLLILSAIVQCTFLCLNCTNFTDLGTR